METLLRHWTMLRLVPRHPRKVSTAVLENRLAERGYPTTRRTIQRDLDKLSMEFPLVTDGNKPSGWSWQADAELFDVPGMDTTAALTFCMVESFLSHMLPKGCLAALSPQMQRAKNLLAQSVGQAQATWPDKVQTVPRTQPLLPPALSAEVLETTYDALFRDKRFSGEYRSREEDDYREYIVNPLGLVFADSVIYLVASLWDYTDVRLLALHRFRSAHVLDDPLTKPDGFILAKYLQDGVMGIPVENQAKKVTLTALFEPEAAYHLLESKLSVDQQATPQNDGRLLIKATVNDTYQLRWWLLGFGAQVEILEPKSLRNEFACTAQAMNGMYQQGETI